jgi:protein TonB
MNYQALQEGLKGKVYATFIVEKDGSLSDIKILRDIGYGTEKRQPCIETFPNWTQENK